MSILGGKGLNPPGVVVSGKRVTEAVSDTERRRMDSVTEATFEQEVLKSEKPVIVDFWAEWCGPCHAIAPVLERIADEHSDLRVVKINIDEEQGIAMRYGIASIPTVVLFKDGEPAAAAIGAQPKSALEKSLGLVSEAAA